ncbi:MAG: hypothetical protein IKV43_03515 [Clostridia bacterium]|nr:hypothetical protein [Clostridia bacterium]
MKYLITKNSYGDLVGFVPFADGNILPAQREYFTDFVADVLPAATLNVDAAEVYWLYEVLFDGGDAVFVTAFDYSDAIVTAALSLGERRLPVAVREYDLYEMREEGSTPCIIHEFAESGEPTRRLISCLTDANRDFVAHCLMYIDGLDEESIREYESQHIKSTIHISGKTALDLTAAEIREVCQYIWNNHLLFEATCPPMSVRHLFGRHEKETDPTLALLWTYAFEQWAHYDCHLAYTLYRLIVDGVLDAHVDGFLSEREILE